MAECVQRDCDVRITFKSAYTPGASASRTLWSEWHGETTVLKILAPTIAIYPLQYLPAAHPRMARLLQTSWMARLIQVLQLITTSFCSCQVCRFVSELFSFQKQPRVLAISDPVTATMKVYTLERTSSQLPSMRVMTASLSEPSST